MNVAGSSDGVATQVMLSSDIAENEAPEGSDEQDNSTIPCPVIEEPHTPLPPVYDSYASMVDQALQRLDDAARRIAAVERNRPRGPRAARLTPLRDISSEVERNNTPLPGSEEAVDDEPGEGEQQANNLPDLWPWLQGGDTGEQDVWSGQNDPLMARRFPDSAEAARIEEEDMQRAIAEGLATRSLPQARTGTKRLRRAFAFLAIMAVLALTIDSVLLSMAFLRGRHTQEAPGGPPTLTLSSSVVTYGQSITVYVKHFSPSGRVFLTHDIQEPLLLNTGKAVLPLGQNGAAQATVFIDNNWQPGFHTIVAEDIATRYTANAMLRVAGGPTRPSHLLLGVSELDLGAAIQGANIIQPFTLHNAGNGAITWTTSSNQPWLMLSPNQGVFSDSQTISIGAQTAGLKPGDYKATLTFSSNVGPPQDLLVTMTVRPLPTGTSSVLTVTPAVISFTAQSGAPDPAAQFLVVSNPGTQPLSWSLTRNTPAGPSQQATPTANANWLSISQTSGVVPPGGSSSIKVTAQQNNLLPGTYTNMLVFSAGNGALNSPQNVNVSFTVQPACSLTLSAGSLSFTAVAQGSNPSNQALNLAATSGCSSTVAWQATSSASWLKITPANGQLSGSASTTTTVGVNINGLAPGTYNATISLTTAQSTQSVSVTLAVQAAPPPTAPVMGASPLNLNFTAVQGQANPPGQTVTIVNTGGSSLLWHTTVNQLASSWLGASPTGGTIAAGQTGHVTVNVNASSLTPGTYVGQVVLSGTDANNAAAGGSPQTIAINLVVSAPCTLVKPSSSAVAMSGIQGTASVAPQSITLSASGSCNWPLSWNAQVPGSASWLNLSASSGSFTASGQSTTISLSPNAANLAPGTYTTQVSVSATDASHLQAQGSPQVFSVTLTVQQPCVLQVTPANLSFSLAQGQSSQNPQTLNISETGACGSVIWKATIDNGSSQWLALSATSGTNSGTIDVSANAANLAAGSYSGTITISATGSGGTTVQGSPQAVPVSLTVAASGSTS